MCLDRIHSKDQQTSTHLIHDESLGVGSASKKSDSFLLQNWLSHVCGQWLIIGDTKIITTVVDSIYHISYVGGCIK